MNKTYLIHAWCVRPFISWIEIEAETPEEALSKARLEGDTLLDAAEECNTSYPWDEFSAYGEDGNELLHVLDHEARLREAAPALLTALKELLADIDGLAGEFEICHEIIHSSYGKAAYKAIAEVEGSLRHGRLPGA